MSFHSKKFSRIFLLAGLMIFALSMSVFGAELQVSTSGDLANAINSASVGDIIKLTSSIDLGSEGTYNDSGKDFYGINISGKEIILDLNGNNLYSTCNKSTIKVESGATLTISGDGEVRNDAAGKYVIRNFGELTINGGTYKSNADTYVYALYIAEGSETVINNGTFEDYIASNGYSAKNDLTINNGTFTRMLYLPGAGDYVINGGNFSINSNEIPLSDSNATIEVKRGTLTINGGTFEMNVNTEDNVSAKIDGNGSGNFKGTVLATKKDGYNGDVVLNINGGTFINKNGDAIIAANESDTLAVNVNIDGEDVVVKGNITTYSAGDGVEKIDVLSGTITELNAIASVNGSKYNTLEEAFAYAKDGETITMLANCEFKNTLEISNGNEYTLDIKTFELSATEELGSMFDITNGKLTVKGTGTISAINDVFGVYGGTNAGELEISEGVNVESNVSNCVYIRGEGAKLTTAGNLTSRANDENLYCTIQGNGNTGAGGIEIYITGGKVINEKSIAIYFPNTSLLDITGGYIKGTTAIYQKAGTLTISGEAKIEAFGPEVSYAYNGDGANDTGEAVVVDFCNYPGGTPAISVTGGYFKSANNRDIGSYATVEGSEIVGFISGGYFKTNPSEYLVDGKAAVASDDSNYNFMIGEKDPAIELDTTTKAGEAETELNAGDVTASDFKNDFEADSSVLESLATLIATDPTKIETSGDVIVAALEAVVGAGVNSGDVTVVVQPYIDVTLTSGDKATKYLSFEIEAKYNVVATKESGDFEIGVNAALIGSGDLEVTKTIKMVIALPEGFATLGDVLFVHHTKENGKKYTYETTISGDTIIFDNPNGFSTFEVKSAAAQNETTGKTYATLKDAIAEVKNNETIILLSNNEETMQVGKDLTFTLDKSIFAFSGDITAGANTTVSKQTSGDTEIIYTFDYTAPSRPSTGGGGSSTETYKITVTQTEGGTISPKSTNVEEGKDIEFTIKANEGYKIVDVIVDAKSVGVVETYKFEDVKEKHAITATFAKEGEWTNPYTDVNEKDWYYDAVKFVNEKGLFNGMGNGKFEPETTMTRGMLVTVLYRLAGATSEELSAFEDVAKNSYYSKAIAWATKLGVVNGIGDNKFAPDQEITREQLATMLYRYAVISKKDVSAGENTNILSYDDFGEISEYAIEAFQWACGDRIVKGRTESTLVPQGNAKRCEVALMIQRFCEK